MFIKACLNGSRKLGNHPLLPVKPEELARDAAHASQRRESGAGHGHREV